MNIRVLAGAAAIAVTGVLAYGFYQLMPEGEPLARSEVIGELELDFCILILFATSKPY